MLAHRRQSDSTCYASAVPNLWRKMQTIKIAVIWLLSFCTCTNTPTYLKFLKDVHYTRQIKSYSKN